MNRRRADTAEAGRVVRHHEGTRQQANLLCSSRTNCRDVAVTDRISVIARRQDDRHGRQRNDFEMLAEMMVGARSFCKSTRTAAAWDCDFAR